MSGGFCSLWDAIQSEGREAQRRATRTPPAPAPPAGHPCSARQPCLLSLARGRWWASCWTPVTIPPGSVGPCPCNQQSFSQDPISNRLRKNRFEFTAALTLAFRTTLGIQEGSRANLEPQQTQNRKSTLGERFRDKSGCSRDWGAWCEVMSPSPLFPSCSGGWHILGKGGARAPPPHLKSAAEPSLRISHTVTDSSMR